MKIEECQWADFLHRYRYVKPSPLAESFLFLGIKDQELHLDAWDTTRIVFLGSRKQSDSCLIVGHDISGMSFISNAFPIPFSRNENSRKIHLAEGIRFVA